MMMEAEAGPRSPTPLITFLVIPRDKILRVIRKSDTTLQMTENVQARM